MKILKLLESEIRGVNWDRKNGLGIVPDQANLDYMGFERVMSGMEFRSLVPAGVANEDTKDYAIGLIKEGKPIAPPFLSVYWCKVTNAWYVYGHEGRSRTDAAMELGVAGSIPVSMLPREDMRARDITDEMRTAPIFGQRGSATYKERPPQPNRRDYD